MASVVNFTSYQRTEDYYCSLLEIDQTKILLDCGIPSRQLDAQLLQTFTNRDAKFCYEHLELLKEFAKSIDVILITAADVSYIGGLCLIAEHLNDTCPILCTVPVHSLSQIIFNEIHISLERNFGFEDSKNELDINFVPHPFSLAAIKKVMDRIVPLRYYQKFHIYSSSCDLSFTPYASGSDFGGAIWRIQKPPYDDIIYAMHFSHKKNELTDGAKFSELPNRPTLFICDSRKALSTGTNRAERKNLFNASLKDSLARAVSQKSNLVIVLDSISRFLEALFILNNEFHDQSMRSMSSLFDIYTTGFCSREFFETAKGLLEWASVSLTQQFESSKKNPLSFTNFKAIASLEEFQGIRGHFVMLAFTPSLLSSIIYKQLFDNIICRENIILWSTDFYGAESVESNAILGNGQFLKRTFEFLQGDDLAQFNESKEAARQTEEAKEVLSKIIQTKASKFADSTGIDFLKSHITSTSKLKMYLWTSYKQDLPISRHVAGGFSKYPLFTLGVDLMAKNISDEYGQVFEAPKNTEIEASRTELAKLEAEDQIQIFKQPYRWSTEIVHVKANSNLRFFDFSCSSDSKSVLSLISSLNPRKVIFTSGTKEDRSYYRNSIKVSRKIDAGIFYFGEPFAAVNASSSLSVCQLPIVGMEQSSLIKLESLSVGYFGIKTVPEGVHQVSPAKHLGSSHLLVGNLKLSDLKLSLSKNAFVASEAVSLTLGELIVGSSVKVRKLGPSEVSVEANYSDSYFVTRKLLLSKLADFE